jgi:hypothetical protein
MALLRKLSHRRLKIGVVIAFVMVAQATVMIIHQQFQIVEKGK